MAGAVQLPVQLGTYGSTLHFIIYKTLSVPVVLGTHLCDRFVQEILTRLRTLELNNGSLIHIFKRALKTRSRSGLIQLPEHLNNTGKSGRTDTAINAAESILVSLTSNLG